MPQRPINRSSQGWLISSLRAQHSQNYRHSSEASQTPDYFRPPWGCPRPSGCWGGSRRVGHEASHCLLSVSVGLEAQSSLRCLMASSRLEGMMLSV